MSRIRLAKLPDRTPVKLTINLAPELFLRLQEYAKLYVEIYGVDEPITVLIPAMLSDFLESDRAFIRGLAAKERRHESRQS